MPAKFKIQISKPCQEKWGDMQPDIKGKFCSSCQKVVTDFTRFSDRDLQDWFNKNKVGNCGRFKPEQLDRYVGEKNRLFFSYFKLRLIAASIFAFSSMPKLTYAKKTDLLKPVFKTQYRQVSNGHDGEFTFVSGKVYDQNGVGLNDINIELKGQNIYSKTVTDGSFFIKIKKPKNKTIAELIFTSNAYEIKRSLFFLGEEKEVFVVLKDIIQFDIKNSVTADKVSEQLIGTLGGISIKMTLSKRIINSVLSIFK